MRNQVVLKALTRPETRRHDRVVRVERRAVIGAAWRLDQALTHSEEFVDGEHVVHRTVEI